jgi:hypothetical protein
MRRLALLLIVLLTFTPGCATIVGTSTGAITGMVDLPSETYKQSETVRDFPVLLPAMVIMTVAIGAGAGPLAGFFKGVSDDVQWVVGWVGYGKVFGTFEKASIWRPWTFSIEQGRNVNVEEEDEAPENLQSQ